MRDCSARTSASVSRPGLLTSSSRIGSSSPSRSASAGRRGVLQRLAIQAVGLEQLARPRLFRGDVDRAPSARCGRAPPARVPRARRGRRPPRARRAHESTAGRSTPRAAVTASRANPRAARTTGRRRTRRRPAVRRRPRRARAAHRPSSIVRTAGRREARLEAGPHASAVVRCRARAPRRIAADRRTRRSSSASFRHCSHAGEVEVDFGARARLRLAEHDRDEQILGDVIHGCTPDDRRERAPDLRHGAEDAVPGRRGALPENPADLLDRLLFEVAQREGRTLERRELGERRLHVVAHLAPGRLPLGPWRRAGRRASPRARRRTARSPRPAGA